MKHVQLKIGEQTINVKAPKADVERFKSGISEMLQAASYQTTITGIIGKPETEHKSTCYLIFGANTLANPEEYQSEKAELLRSLPDVVTAENMNPIIEAARAIRIKHTPIKDERETQEQRTEDLRKSNENHAAFEKENNERKAKENAGRAALPAQYPYLTPKSASDKSTHALGAANLRIHLNRTFPGIQFSVKSETYSMGSSIHVGWTDGPTDKEVREISDLYQYCSFDGMQDMEVQRDNLFEEVFGGTKYVSENRTFSDEKRAEMTLEMFPTGEVTEDDKQMVWRKWQETSFPGSSSSTVAPIENKEGIQVRKNDVKGGIEVLFPEKPAQEVIDSLHAHGFRWSRPQRLWWTRFDDRKWDFARELAA